MQLGDRQVKPLPIINYIHKIPRHPPKIHQKDKNATLRYLHFDAETGDRVVNGFALGVAGRILKIGIQQRAALDSV